MEIEALQSKCSTDRELNEEKSIQEIEEYLEDSYTGARMLDQEEAMLRIARALFAFKADINEEIFSEAVREREVLKECAISQLDMGIVANKDYSYLQSGNPVWYVNFEESKIEKGTISGIYFKDGNVDSFSVDFENGDFDEFYGESIGKRFFLTKEAADEAFVKGE